MTLEIFWKRRGRHVYIFENKGILWLTCTAVVVVVCKNIL